jgi:hypothetical protein
VRLPESGEFAHNQNEDLYPFMMMYYRGKHTNARKRLASWEPPLVRRPRLVLIQPAFPVRLHGRPRLALRCGFDAEIAWPGVLHRGLA